MITPTIFYKHMKNFVSSNPNRGSLCYIYFDGRQALASNGHMICSVKNWEAVEHYELPDGTRVDKDGVKYPETSRILSMLDASKVGFELTDSVCSFDRLSKTLKYFLDLTKGKDIDNVFLGHACCLKMMQGILSIYISTQDMNAKAELTNRILDIEGLPDFEQYFNAQYLLSAINFIKDTKATSVQVRLKEYAIAMDTPDIRIIMTGLKPDVHTQLVRFVKSDSPDNAADLDFLA